MPEAAIAARLSSGSPPRASCPCSPWQPGGPVWYSAWAWLQVVSARAAAHRPSAGVSGACVVATSLPSNDHKTGKGHVKFKKGEYHDALTVKRNEVCLLLHENLGGGFSPPAAHKIRRLGRKARSGIDRTPYKTDRKISFVSYHTRSISMNITRAEAWQLHKAVNTAKGDLCRHRDRNPTGGA